MKSDSGCEILAFLQPHPSKGPCILLDSGQAVGHICAATLPRINKMRVLFLRLRFRGNQRESP